MSHLKSLRIDRSCDLTGWCADAPIPLPSGLRHLVLSGQSTLLWSRNIQCNAISRTCAELSVTFDVVNADDMFVDVCSILSHLKACANAQWYFPRSTQSDLPVHRVNAAFGHPVESLQRVRVGGMHSSRLVRICRKIVLFQHATINATSTAADTRHVCTPLSEFLVDSL